MNTSIAALPGVRDGFTDSIGNTPLIRLRSFSEETGCEILGKAEFMNPGGSVKDRAAKWIVLDAERRGVLKPGGTVVEGTAATPHRSRACMQCPRLQMRDRHAGQSSGREIPDHRGAGRATAQSAPRCPTAIRTSTKKSRAGWLKNCRMPCGPISSTTPRTNWRIFESTGPEIWRDTGGKIHAFCASTGTGGTLAGVARYLKSKSAAVRIVLVDPPGSALFHYIKDGELKTDGGSSITEGIGTGRVTANLQGAPIDDALRIADAETLRFVYRLLREEGLLLGSTAGINVAAAVTLAKQMGPGHTIVTVLCDGGAKYQSRLFNHAWLEERGFLEAIADPSSPALTPTAEPPNPRLPAPRR